MIRRLVGILVVAIALFVPAMEAGAQSFDPRISVRLGVIDESSGSNLSTLYPEIEVENRLVEFTKANVALNGSAYVGYWNDQFGLREYNCEDCLAYRSLTVGARTRLVLTKPILPFETRGSFFGGVSYHAVEGEGATIHGPASERQGYVAGGAGLRIDIPLFMKWRFVGQIQARTAFSGADEMSNHSFSLGLNTPL